MGLLLLWKQLANNTTRLPRLQGLSQTRLDLRFHSFIVAFYLFASREEQAELQPTENHYIDQRNKKPLPGNGGPGRGHINSTW